MAVLTERIHVLLSQVQAARLRELARREGRSVGELIREAIDDKYFRQEEEQRLAAVRRMAAMRLPVADWQQMERESIPWTEG